ncbi:MAG TPA: diguanylate cyclase [Blastocatellia bacterium]|nr:diguanylate cyclase [Blastocatellia bacterium]
MRFEYDPIILPFIVSAVITVILGTYAFRQSGPVARVFAWMMVPLTFWTICYTLELSGATLQDKAFWLKLKYLGSAPAPLISFIFAIISTGYDRLLGKPLRAALIAWVAVVWIAVFTNDFHHLFWARMWIAPGIPDTTVKHGPLFSLYSLGCYSFVLGSVVLYLRNFRVTPAFFRRQAVLLMLGGFAPIASRIPKDFFGVDFFPKVDEVIFFVLFSGILYAIAIFKYGALDIVHIAHDIVVRNIGAGIVVQDVLGRVVELNPYARELFGVDNESVTGKKVIDALPEWPDLDSNEKDGEICIQREEEPAYFVVQNSNISDNRGVKAGSVTLLFDVTTLKNAERELEKLARTDPLTGVANRRSFFEAAAAEFARSSRHQRALTVMMIDIDHFKGINDRYGHRAGDEVLIQVAAECVENVRETDLFARYGGEEFICLLTDSDPAGALLTAERIRQVIEGRAIEVDGQTVTVTVSVGLAHLSDLDRMPLEELINRADHALYESKSDGRNRVTTWRSSPDFMASGTG